MLIINVFSILSPREKERGLHLNKLELLSTNEVYVSSVNIG